MSLPDFSRSQIGHYRNKREIIRLTAQQVIRDFALFGIEVTFSGDTLNAYDELFEQLASCLTELLDTDYRKLLALLYHIDISENELSKHMAHCTQDHPELIAGMILDRELKKVLIRKFYRG